MQKYSGVVIDAKGAPMTGVTVTVNVAGGGAASIFSDNGVTSKANPFTNDANGSFEFYAANGRYDIVLAKTGVTFVAADTSDVALFDPLASSAVGSAKPSFRGLRVFSDPDEPSERMRIVCPELVLVDSAGTPKRYTGVDIVADLGSAGANGLDTGSKANSTDYDLYVIGKTDGTIAGLFAKALQWVKDQDYSDASRDAALALRDASARTQIAQGFQVSQAGVLHSIEISLLRVGTAAGALWAEIQTNASGVPSNTLVTGGRSLIMPITDVETTNRIRLRLVFPERPTLASGTQYHLVLKGDWTINASNHLTVGVDASSPSYANGAVSTHNGTSWTADSTRDFALFTVNLLTGAESPTMPSGYEFRGRVSWNRTDGSGILIPVLQDGDLWRRLDFAITALSTTSMIWTAYDFAGLAPPAWALEYDLVIEGNGGSMQAVAAPLPLGVPDMATVQGTYHEAAAGSGAGRFMTPLRLRGMIGPMFWGIGTGASAGYSIRGARLAL